MLALLPCLVNHFIKRKQMAMDRVEFHRLAVLFSGGLIEREMRASFPRRHFARKRRRSLSCEKKNADAFTPAF